jgi:hypothetical protein
MSSVLVLYLLMNYTRLLAAVGTVTCYDLCEQYKLTVETVPSTRHYSVPPLKKFVLAYCPLKMRERLMR